MRVSDVMERDIDVVHPEQSLYQAARLMLESSTLILPVEQDDRLVGLITRRDIAVRAPAEGKTAASPVCEVMTRDLKYCFDDEDHEQVQANMGEHRLGRLPVLDREGRLVGMLPLPSSAVPDQHLGAALRELAGVSTVAA